MFLLMAPNPEGARRRVMEERGEEWLYQRALSDPHGPIRNREQGLEAA